jgi:hypothetical protein
MSLRMRLRALERTITSLTRRVLVRLPGGHLIDSRTGRATTPTSADYLINLHFNPMTEAELETARARVQP